MSEPVAERALTILTDAARVALPLSELAGRLGHGDPASLGRQLEADDRFAVVEVRAFPALAPDPRGRDGSYAAALRAAGLAAAPLVARTGMPAPPGAPVDALLRDSMGRLLAVRVTPSLVAAAARVHDAVVAVMTPAGAAPSTTPPPGPRR